MKQEREESSCAPHEDEPRWIFAHQLTISSLAWWLSLSNVLNIILRSQAHDHPGPLILSNTSSSIMGLYLLTNLFNEWVSCKYFSFFFRRFTVDDHSNDAREIATFFFNNFFNNVTCLILGFVLLGKKIFFSSIPWFESLRKNQHQLLTPLSTNNLRSTLWSALCSILFASKFF